MANASEVQRIVGLLKSDPAFLIKSVWDNNPNGVLFALQQNGFPNDVLNLEQLTILITKLVQLNNVPGETIAQMLASVPTSYTARNYTTTPEFIEAFAQFDAYMQVKEKYNG